MERKVMISSDEIQKMIMGQVSRLAKVVRIEKTCTNKEAADTVAYFLKQIIYILENEKDVDGDLTKDK